MTAPDVTSPALTIAQIILESCEFRHKRDPLTSERTETHERTPAHVGVELITSPGQEAAAVRLRVISDAPEAPYYYAVSYLVLFKLEAPPAKNDHAVMLTGAAMAIPFARELIANMTGRGRFGPSWLSPVNLQAMSTTEQPKLLGKVKRRAKRKK